MTATPVIGIALAIVGLVLVALALVYLLDQAGDLPHAMPGYRFASTRVLYRPGAGALLAGAICLLGARLLWHAPRPATPPRP